MSLVDFIENLQRKPYPKRLKIFLAAILISIALTITGFGFSINYSLHNSTPTNAKAGKKEKNNDTMPSLREMIKSSAAEIFNFKNRFNQNAPDPNKQKQYNQENAGLRLPH
ncbi:MAG: hypothetical protein US76_04305 [Parcubacteria group bacterium GW2011_GWA2_38_13b]|nr:MAG: hypothetical protein US76_04305 [Parcubacteria group bacterium GW2011_GWA2_38_13b]